MQLTLHIDRVIRVTLCQLYTPINVTVSSFCRHQYFLHLKRDLDEGKIIPEPEKAATVYALIAQATIGDHGDSYSPCDFCQASEVESQWTSEFRSNVSVEHAKFKGLRSATAKQFFIKELSSMENYGMEYHLAKNESGQSLHIGVGSEEIKIYDGDLNFIERYEQLPVNSCTNHSILWAVGTVQFRILIVIMNSFEVYFFLSTNTQLRHQVHKLKPLQEIRCIVNLDFGVQKSGFEAVFGAYSTTDEHIFSALN